MSGGRLFLLPPKILDSLEDFGLYTFALRPAIYEVLAALAFKQCIPVDSRKTATRKYFVC